MPVAHFKLTLHFFLHHVQCTQHQNWYWLFADKAQKSGKMTATIHQNGILPKYVAAQQKRDISMANGDFIMQ